MGKWAVEMEYEEGLGAKLYAIGVMSFLGVVDVSEGAAEPFDLAYAEVLGDLQPYWQPRDEQAQIVNTLPRVIFQPDLHYQPGGRKLYGFAGGVKQTEEHHFGKLWHGTELVCYPTLKYAGEDERFYFFKLPFAHPGHEFFKGTSGAPICARKGNTPPLVRGPRKRG